ncbi:MAG: DUF4292 domain-containing protein [Bacteroidota bacterium]
MYRKVLWGILIFSLVISCKSSKATKTELAGMSSKNIIKKHYTNKSDINKIKGSFVVKYRGKNEIPNLNASLRFARDSAIWISFSKLGFPVGKIFITKNGVKFYEKINKSYFDGDFSLISNWMGTEFDFQKIQNLFLGETLIDLKAQKFYSQVDQNNYLLVPKKKNPIFDMLVWIDPVNFKVKKEEFKKYQADVLLTILYKNYTALNEVLIPNRFSINVKDKKKKTNIDINYNDMFEVTRLTFPFKIPENYKPIKLK